MKQSVTDCPILVNYQYFKDNAWTDFSTILHTAIKSEPIPTGDGQVKVLVDIANKDSFCPEQSYLIRVTYTSEQSLNALRSIYDEYTITI